MRILNVVLFETGDTELLRWPCAVVINGDVDACHKFDETLKECACAEEFEDLEYDEIVDTALSASGVDGQRISGKIPECDSMRVVYVR